MDFQVGLDKQETGRRPYNITEKQKVVLAKKRSFCSLIVGQQMQKLAQDHRRGAPNMSPFEIEIGISKIV